MFPISSVGKWTTLLIKIYPIELWGHLHQDTRDGHTSSLLNGDKDKAFTKIILAEDRP